MLLPLQGTHIRRYYLKKMREIITILGVPIDNITKEESGTITEELIKSSNKSCKMVFAPNVEFIMMANKDK